VARPELLAVLRSAADSGEPDGVLLGRFAAGHHAAFAELVRRYARLVWGQCRNLLNNEADAAFQATFLTLAKSAKSIRDTDRLGPWLHGVAYKVCLNARRAAARRKKRERASAVGEAVSPVADSAWETAAAGVSEEVSRLPESLRVPFVLCHVEGRSPTEAAAQLGWRWGTFSSRLSRAKQRLLTRLAARGVGAAVAVGLIGGGMIASAAAVERAAELGPNPASASASVVSLTAGVRAMTRVKLLAVVAMVAGVGMLFVSGGGNPTPVAVATAAPAPKDAEEKKQRLESDWEKLLNTHSTQAVNLACFRFGRADDVVPFLKAKLRPIDPTEDQSRRWLADLSSDDPELWKPACDGLVEQHPLLVLTFEEAWKVLPEKGVGRKRFAILCFHGYQARHAEVIEKTFDNDVGLLNFGKAGFIFVAKYTPEMAAIRKQAKEDWTFNPMREVQNPVLDRVTLAVGMLESIGTPAAKKLLDEMATGHPDAGPTKAAKVALGRLKK
jgi:RNA polymerase sigma factor (sigma-70 family)